jgi:hypothetical protein
MEGSWKSDLERWLAPFISALRHKTRARMCPAYFAGLIGAGDRKSMQPMAARDVPVMVGLRLFLPESWTSDPERIMQARVPEVRRGALSKPEIAIEEIDRVIASGVRFGCVLADSGPSGPFRQALSARGLLWAVGLSRCQNVYPADVAVVFSVAKARKRRKYHIPGGDGHKRRMRDNRMQYTPGDEVWLVGERRLTGEKNTMCRTCRAMRAGRSSPPRSNPDGFLSRRISSSKRYSASITSKIGPGPGCIDTP